MHTAVAQAQKQVAKLLTDRKKKRFPLFEEYVRSCRLPLDQIQERQLRKLETLLEHSFREVPFYRDRIGDSGLLVDGKVRLSAPSDITKLPLLTRSDIEANQAALASRDNAQRKIFKNSSGGSTGEPVHLLQDENYSEQQFAHTLLIRSWLGVDPFDHVLKIWGAIRDTYAGGKPLDVKVKDFLRNRTTLNCFEMNAATMRTFLVTLNARKPPLIVAYVQAIYELARFAIDEKIPVERQKCIQTSTGTLFDSYRKQIKDVFGCSVCNHYGSREVSAIASECLEEDGLHLLMEHNVTEVIDGSGRSCAPGEEGEICVTNLNNYAFPLIRYQIGDCGILAPHQDCACGVNYPKLKAVTGRVLDSFRTRDGRLVEAHFFNMIIHGSQKSGAIQRYQVVQKDYEHIVFRFIAREPVSPETLQEIERGARVVMGENCKVDFEMVSEIPLTATGKHRFVICEIPTDSD